MHCVTLAGSHRGIQINQGMEITVVERERARKREIQQLAGSAEDHTWKKEWMANQCERVQHTVFGQSCPPNAPFSVIGNHSTESQRERVQHTVFGPYVLPTTQFSFIRN